MIRCDNGYTIDGMDIYMWLVKEGWYVWGNRECVVVGMKVCKLNVGCIVSNWGALKWFWEYVVGWNYIVIDYEIK